MDSKLQHVYKINKSDIQKTESENQKLNWAGVAQTGGLKATWVVKSQRLPHAITFVEIRNVCELFDILLVGSQEQKHGKHPGTPRKGPATRRPPPTANQRATHQHTSTI